MKKILILLNLIFLITIVTASPAMASTIDQIKAGLGVSGEAFNGSGEQRDFVDAWSIYVSGLAGILSALFLVIIIYGGWLWMTARGNEEQVGKAKRIIVGSIIGIVIIISGRLIAELAITYLNNAVITANEA